VIVSDGTATDSETITVTVTEVNAAPVLATIGDKTVAELSLLSFTASATDTDLPAQTLTYSLGPGAPAGAAINPSTGAFSWTPTEAQGPNSYPVTVIVSDGTATDSETITVTVTDGSVPPPAPYPVYRFYNFTNNTHFFTPSEDEKNMILATWPDIFSLDGPAYSVNPANNTQPLYRFYNKVSRSHFYTASVDEKNGIIANLWRTFDYDGETYSVNPGPVANSIPAHRFFNKQNGSHFLTTTEAEVESVRANLAHVYEYEGPAFWIGQ
ncbi:hypothetical protein EG835_09955, partial [bacterium]|nr:hypothetical protein [bacterium]